MEVNKVIAEAHSAIFKLFGTQKSRTVSALYQQMENMLTRSIIPCVCGFWWGNLIWRFIKNLHRMLLFNKISPVNGGLFLLPLYDHMPLINPDLRSSFCP